MKKTAPTKITHPKATHRREPTVIRAFLDEETHARLLSYGEKKGTDANGGFGASIKSLLDENTDLKLRLRAEMSLRELDLQGRMLPSAKKEYLKVREKPDYQALVP